MVLLDVCRCVPGISMSGGAVGRLSLSAGQSCLVVHVGRLSTVCRAELSWWCCWTSVAVCRAEMSGGAVGRLSLSAGQSCLVVLLDVCRCVPGRVVWWCCWTSVAECRAELSGGAVGRLSLCAGQRCLVVLLDVCR